MEVSRAWERYSSAYDFQGDKQTKKKKELNVAFIKLNMILGNVKQPLHCFSLKVQFEFKTALPCGWARQFSSWISAKGTARVIDD